MYNIKSEISNVCNAVELYYLQVMKIGIPHASSRFAWIVSGHQGVDPLRKVISILNGKLKGFVHPAYFKVFVNCQLIVYISADKYFESMKACSDHSI